jgi:hypothetical protein
LKEHDIDEYFLDDEGEWTQNDQGGWSWRASEHDIHFDFDEDKDSLRVPNVGSDPENFLTDSSQDLLLTSLGSRLLSSATSSLADTHNQSTREHNRSPIADPDRNWCFLDQSRDDPDPVQMPPSSASAHLSTLMQDKVPPLIVRNNTQELLLQRPLSGTAYLDHLNACDMNFDSDSEMLYDFDTPDSVAEDRVTPTCSPFKSDVEPFLIRVGDRWEEEGVWLDFDID